MQGPHHPDKGVPEGVDAKPEVLRRSFFIIFLLGASKIFSCNVLNLSYAIAC